jgi:hypothetical protein
MTTFNPMQGKKENNQTQTQTQSNIPSVSSPSANTKKSLMYRAINTLKTKLSTSPTSPQTPRELYISDLYVKSVYADKFDEQYGLRLNNSQEPKNSYKIIIEIGIEKTGLFSKQKGGKLIIVWGPEKKFFDLLNIVSFNINGKSLNDYKVTSRIDVLGKLWGELKGGKLVGDVNVSCGQNPTKTVSKKDLLLYFILNLVKTCSISNSNNTLNKRMKYLKIDKIYENNNDMYDMYDIFIEPLRNFDNGIKMFNRNKNIITFEPMIIKSNQFNNLNKARKQKILKIEHFIATGTPEQTPGGQGQTSVQTSAIPQGTRETRETGTTTQTTSTPAAAPASITQNPYASGEEAKKINKLFKNEGRSSTTPAPSPYQNLLGLGTGMSGGSRRRRRTTRSRSRSRTTKKTTKKTTKRKTTKKRTTKKRKTTKKTTKK